VRTTFLGAHTVPAEFDGRADAYIDLVVEEMLPAVAKDKLADAVDAFCEKIAFSPEQTERVFHAAAGHGLPVKLHADQLSDLGGAALAARYKALSADHLEYTSDAGVAAMAKAGTVAVLRRARSTSAETAAAAGAIPRRRRADRHRHRQQSGSAGDLDPADVNMACTLFRMTPEEALSVTRHAAMALGLKPTAPEAGKAADFAIWNIERPAELCYRIGFNPCAGVVRGGEAVGKLAG
jgi:imidazolonepropionase